MNVEIWSDIACPWCYIGKRRFEQALSQFEHAAEVQVRWRSFELDPEAPLERTGERTARLAEKYGMSIQRAREIELELTRTAAGEGLEFHFELARSGLTFDAHRVVHLAAESRLQDAMKERLLRAYFTEGELVGEHATLLRLAVEMGLDGEEVSEMLASERFAQQVHDDERMAHELGVRAVPTFVVDRAIGVSGAEPPAALLGLLREGWARQSASSAVGEG